MLYGYLNSPFVSNPFSDAAIPPKSLTSPVISGSGVVGQTLSTTDGTWTGTAPITFAYQWNRNGSIILGATFNTYTLVTADASTSITCTVTATNVGGSVSKNSNAISVASAPVNTIAPLATGSGVTGQTLSTTTGTWTGTAPITYAYQWKRDNATITGATSSTYLLVTADENKAVKCTITATNVAGSVSADSNSINVVPATDADANAFIAAAAITDTTQKAAINKLVVDLKGYGIWTKMKAIYPFIGGTSTQHKYNLRNPLDTDAAFRLVFNGGWTHSSTGSTPNRTNAWADSKLIPNSVLINNNYHLAYYSRTSELGYAASEIGCVNSNSQALGIRMHDSGLNGKFFYSGPFPANTVLINNTDTTGLMIGSRFTIDSAKIYQDGSFLASNTSLNTGILPTISLGVGAQNYTGFQGEYSGKECALASIGDGLTDTESANYYTAVQAFQTTLSRNV